MGAILEDSRQQAGKHDHVAEWMEAHGVPFMQRSSALPFGDYVRDGSNISVDTKRDVQELAMDVGRDHERFKRECLRARDAGWRLYVLVEEHPEYNDRERLKGWVSTVCRRCRHVRCGRCKGPSTQGGRRCPAGWKPMQGQTVAAILGRMEERYGVVFRFCARRDTARVICELLGVEVEDG